MAFEDIKAYRSSVFNDKTGWDFFDEEVQEKLNKAVAEFCRKPKNDELLRAKINNIFAACRYSFVLRSKDLRKNFISKTICSAVEEKNELLETLTNHMFLQLWDFIGEKFDLNKNDNFSSYFFTYAPKLVIEKLRLELSEIKIPTEQYRMISKLIRIRNDYYAENYAYPDYEELADIYNRYVKNEKAKIDKVKAQYIMLLLGEREPVHIESGAENKDDKPQGIAVKDPNDLIEKAEILDSEHNSVTAFTDSFSTMLNYGQFLKHYGNDSRKTKPERYSYFQMFYTCDTVKYLKGLPQLRDYLLARSNKILSVCDDAFFKYILFCGQNGKINSLDEILFSKFKKYKDLEVNVFDKKDLGQTICVEEQKTGQEKGIIKLKNENLIYSSFKIAEKGKGIQSKASEKSNVSQHLNAYNKYNYAFTYKTLKDRGDKENKN